MISSNSPGAIPWPVGPTTSAAVTVPVTVPPVVGQGGLPPPPQRKKLTPPLAPRWPRWTCAKSVLAPSSAEYSSSYDRVVPAVSSCARNSPVPVVELEGTSCAPLNVALKLFSFDWPVADGPRASTSAPAARIALVQVLLIPGSSSKARWEADSNDTARVLHPQRTTDSAGSGRSRGPIRDVRCHGSAS